MVTDDFFRARIEQMIDAGHPLARRLPWAKLEAALAGPGVRAQAQANGP